MAASLGCDVGWAGRDWSTIQRWLQSGPITAGRPDCDGLGFSSPLSTARERETAAQAQCRGGCSAGRRGALTRLTAISRY